jgi:class 3 adenylate cyclase/tetratricopeptide (TPR) repeat protein
MTASESGRPQKEKFHHWSSLGYRLLSGGVDSLGLPIYDRAMPVCQRCGEDNPERARFCLGCGAALAAPVSHREERKVVTVLFCDLVGFTSRSERLDVEDVRGLLTPYYARLRSELERFGGTVEKFIGDAVMALFGAPTAHEDDPERAVRAALSIRAAIAEFNQQEPDLDLHVRIGVTTGEALVALDAQPSQGEGMASGDVVNTAARLQAAAPIDGVLVDETTFRATDRAITYRPAEPVTAKGKNEPINVWQALDPQASLGVDVAQAPRAALVGRERELELLRAALARAREEQAPQLVTLVGVPGIGKSRLVFELLQQMEAEPQLTVWRQGRCLPYGEGVALWALGEMVKAQAGILDTDPGDAATDKLDRAVTGLIPDHGEAAWVTNHLRPLVGLGGTVELGGDRRVEAFAAWRRFLEALAERNLTVLVVEDLHWADDTLLDFLDHLVDWATDVPLLVVASARPELLARRPGWGGGKPNAATVSLAPLSEEDTARLVAALLGQALLPAELQSALLARAGGNPLYAEEYVRMLVDRGFLRRAGGIWRLERADQLPLPETVQGIIAARLDVLSPEEKSLLQDAAVLGKVAWLGGLSALAATDPFVLEERLHALERKEFLRRERRSAVAGERQYVFRHALVRDVAYGQLPRPARADKHRRAAEWIQALSPDRAEDRAELLAHHYASALEFARVTGQDTTTLAERARLALRDAGDRAWDLNAFAAAARWYAAALQLWPAADAERPQLLLRLGRARLYAEEAGGDLLAEARDGLLAQGDREAAAEAEGLLGLLLWQKGQGERGMEHDRRAVALLEEAGPSRAKAFTLANLAGTLAMSGQTEAAIQVGRQALTIAEALNLADDTRVRALNYVGCARVYVGDPGGIADLEEAVAIAVATNSPAHAATAYGNLAECLIALGELDRAADPLAKSREGAQRCGMAGQLRWLDAQLVHVDYLRGQWGVALRGADQFLAGAEAGSRHVSDAICWLLRGKIRRARGDLAGALHDADAGLEAAKATKDPSGLYPTLAFHAHTLLAAGRTEEAGARANELVAMLTEQGMLQTVPDWSSDLAIVLGALGRGAEFTECAARAKRPTPWLQAATAVAAGDFERAAGLYAGIGSLPDEAFARLQGARRLLAVGRQAEASVQLQRALAFYRQVGASAYLREGEAILAACA